MNISVIICCYNSENRIVNTLFHLSQCVSLSKGLIDEIILVDNNSSDETVKTAEDFWRNTGRSKSLKLFLNRFRALFMLDGEGWTSPKMRLLFFVMMIIGWYHLILQNQRNILKTNKQALSGDAVFLLLIPLFLSGFLRI